MKRNRAIFKKALICLCIASMLIMPIRAETLVGTLNIIAFSMRAAPSSDAPIVTRAYEGDRMLVVGREGSWYKVYFDGSYCYVPVSYLSVIDIDAEEYKYKRGEVNAASLYLRSGPGSTYSSVKLYTRGTQVIILGEVAGWYKVRIDTNEGYMSSAYITVTFDPADYGPVEMPPEEPVDPENPENPENPQNPEDPENPHPPAVRTCTINTDALNLRDQPSTSGTILGRVLRGEVYAILEEVDGWYKIYHSDFGVGYVSSAYVIVSEDRENEVKVYGVVTGSVLNLRAGPSTAHILLTQIPYGTRVEVLGEAETGWYQVIYNGQTGYVSPLYLRIIETEIEIPDEPIDSAIVLSTTARLYKEGSESSEVLTTLSLGLYVDVMVDRTRQDGWVIVKSGGTLGYVRSSDLLVGIYPYVRPAFTGYRLPGNTVTNITGASGLNTLSTGERIAAYAKTFLGVPCLADGSSPTTGFDASGFVWYVFTTLGYNPPRTNQQDAGIAVSFSELKPGDLVFFDLSGGGINHVGIYLGGDMFIHAPYAGGAVSTADIKSEYYRTKFAKAARIA